MRSTTLALLLLALTTPALLLLALTTPAHASEPLYSNSGQLTLTADQPSAKVDKPFRLPGTTTKLMAFAPGQWCRIEGTDFETWHGVRCTVRITEPEPDDGDDGEAGVLYRQDLHRGQTPRQDVFPGGWLVAGRGLRVRWSCAATEGLGPDDRIVCNLTATSWGK